MVVRVFPTSGHLPMESGQGRGFDPHGGFFFGVSGTVPSDLGRVVTVSAKVNFLRRAWAPNRFCAPGIAATISQAAS